LANEGDIEDERVLMAAILHDTIAMKGSFSIKQVVPTLCSELEYTPLDGVADGGAAQRA
jgi:hypothetical protein